ncbi:MAG TPA: hypothetical protein PJ991_02975 [Kiritimatiellia bacterium]|nr:hypothetical protein [Kiritimatiellia bacterium]
MLDVRFSDWIQKGFELFVNNAVVLLVGGLAALAISAVTLGLLTGPMIAGMAVIILNLLDDRLSKPTLNDLFRGFDYFTATIPVTIGFYVLALLAFLVNYIPYLGQLINSVILSVGIATGILMIFHLVSRKISPADSWKSWLEVFRANWGPLLGFYILALIIGGVGLLACGVGLIVTAPIYLCILGTAYISMVKQSAVL